MVDGIKVLEAKIKGKQWNRIENSSSALSLNFRIYRKAIFSKNLQLIRNNQQAYADGKVKFEMKLNKLADRVIL